VGADLGGAVFAEVVWTERLVAPAASRARLVRSPRLQPRFRCLVIRHGGNDALRGLCALGDPQGSGAGVGRGEVVVVGNDAPGRAASPGRVPAPLDPEAALVPADRRLGAADQVVAALPTLEDGAPPGTARTAIRAALGLRFTERRALAEWQPSQLPESVAFVHHHADRRDRP
jgi:hypothetical protein